MKRIIFMLLTLVMLTMTSCDARKASNAFKDGTLKVGSTYEEVINALGEGDHDYQSPRMRLVRYNTLWIISFYYVKFEPDKEGVMRVVATTDDTTTGNLWEVEEKEKDGKNTLF